MSTAMPFAGSWRKVLLGALVGGLVVISTPAVSHLPDIANVPTLAPLVREITPSVVNISVHGHVKEENPLYRDPLFREFFDVPSAACSIKGLCFILFFGGATSIDGGTGCRVREELTSRRKVSASAGV